MTRRVTLLAVPVLALLGLTGCQPSTTASSVTSSSSPASAAPTAVTLPSSGALAGASVSGQVDHQLTPGHVFADATVAKICVSGYAASARAVTVDTRRKVFSAYQVAYPAPAGTYELDHLIPLELGGDNTAANLWPQVRHGSGSADVKDHLENQLHKLVCAGRLPLAEAQQAMVGDWAAAASKYNAIPTSTSAPATVQPSPLETPPPAPAPPAPAPPAPAPPAPGGWGYRPVQ